MSKELPFFKFEPAEYLTKDISFCSLSAQGLFINICSYYWQRDCILTKEQLLKRLNYPNELNELITEGVIDLNENSILIKFLDCQLADLKRTSIKNKINGSKGGRPNKTQIKPKDNPADNPTNNPTNNPTKSQTKGIRRDKIRKDINNILLSEISISDDKSFFISKNQKFYASEEDIKFFIIANQFRLLFIKNLKARNSPTVHQEKGTYKSYVNPIRLIIQNGEATEEQLREVYRYLNSKEGEFWKSNILSTDKLRKQISPIIAKKNEPIKSFKPNNQSIRN